MGVQGPWNEARMTAAARAEVLASPWERRGYVTVPVDYTDPAAGTLDVLYRVLPGPTGREDASLPYMFVINGGPGISANFYRALDFDYERRVRGDGAPADAPFDRFVTWPLTHRVVLVDQRGTDGWSAPLDMDDERLDAREVARLYSSDSVARDLAAVIQTLTKPGEVFDIIAQSYGGIPGMQYVALPEAPRPRAIVFSSSALPFEDPLAMTRWRRVEQLRLNQELRAAIPDMGQRVLAAREHLAALGAEPSLVDGLFVLLGKGMTGTWEAGVAARVTQMAKRSREEIETEAAAGLEGPNLLNYILSSVNFTPGYTDRTLARWAQAELPFEPWMLDEQAMILKTGQDGGWRQALVDDLDARPPTPTPMPTLAAIHAGLRRTRALFTAADNDAFVPAEGYREAVQRFEVTGHTTLLTLPGGHNAIFHEPGHQAFMRWVHEAT